jgi:hypothetical protein
MILVDEIVAVDLAVDRRNLLERDDACLDEERHEAEAHAVLFLESVLVPVAQRHHRRHVDLVERGQHGGRVLRLFEPLGDALPEARHPHAFLARPKLAWNMRRGRLWRRGGPRQRGRRHRRPAQDGAVRLEARRARDLDPERHRAEADLLARPQERVGHALAVEERAVGAAFVHHEIGGAATLDPRVPSGDRAVVHEHLAPGLASHHGHVLADDDGCAGRWNEPQTYHRNILPRLGISGKF